MAHAAAAMGNNGWKKPIVNGFSRSINISSLFFSFLFGFCWRKVSFLPALIETNAKKESWKIGRMEIFCRRSACDNGSDGSIVYLWSNLSRGHTMRNVLTCKHTTHTLLWSNNRPKILYHSWLTASHFLSNEYNCNVRAVKLTGPKLIHTHTYILHIYVRN